MAESIHQITVSVEVNANPQLTWDYYTQPEHITGWNFASPEWHCPKASNNLTVGGNYVARMEAKDGSVGFDFEAVYTEVNPPLKLSYLFGGRRATVNFNPNNNGTSVVVQFDPDQDHDIELQRAGWQAILTNFKIYTETNSR